MTQNNSETTNPAPEEQDAFTLLYDAYGRKIYNLAYRMTGNQEDAEDITQETFLQAYRSMEGFREESQIYTWIYAIAKNLCYRFFQRQKQASLISFEMLIHDAADMEAPSGITAAEKQHLIGQVKDGCLTGLLRCLSFYQRFAFILHVLLRLPIEEVSRILDKSEGATKVLVHRARLNLKTFLCKNCSLYNPANPCRCEKLLGFSLKQGWITQPSNQEPDDVPIDIHRVEEEIRSIREVVELYASLDEPNPAMELGHRIQDMVSSQSWLILNDGKV